MSSAAEVRRLALALVGRPYSLGNEPWYDVGDESSSLPTATDCSGLIYGVFRKAGVKVEGRPLPRKTADDYWHRARPIAKPEKVGDMCWFPRIGRKTHVGLYIGDDTVMEAGYHGPHNTYPGHGYVGTCTVAQMNARGAVWGRMDTDIEEEDMTEDEVRAIVREEIEIIYSPDVAVAQEYLEDQKIIGRHHPHGKAASIGYVDLVLSRVLRLLSSR